MARFSLRTAALTHPSVLDWHRKLAGMETSPEKYATEAEYINAVNLYSSRIVSFIILLCLALFFPFDLIYLKHHPDKLASLTHWRIAFGGAVALGWVWSRFVIQPSTFTLTKWTFVGIIWSVVGCATGVQIGPFSEPWMACFLLAPMGSIFIVMNFRARIAINTSIMCAGVFTIHFVAPAYTAAPLFPTYLAYVLVGIAIATFSGVFFDKATREHYHRLLALKHHQERLEQMVQERTQSAKEALLRLETSRALVHRAVAKGLQEELGNRIAQHRELLAQSLQMHCENPAWMQAHQTFLQEIAQIEAGAQRVVEEPQMLSQPQETLFHPFEAWLRPYQKNEAFALTWSVHPAQLQLEPALTFTLFRVVQEAMTNIQKHARADTINISCIQHDGTLELIIQDNGVGFDPSVPTERLGLKGIRERLRAVGGQCTIQANTPTGTTITANIPIPSQP